jgi:splicing factor 3B subunit 2
LKLPFKLPDYIEKTGISKLRDINVNGAAMIHQKLRERMKPRMGKMDIDYDVLHDAFFKY